jgi:hypothetical protein
MQGKARLGQPVCQKITHIVVLLALVNGCTTLQLPLYTPQPIHRYNNVQVKDGLAVAVQPMLDVEENEKYFGTNLLALNILPAFVISENRHASSSFILLKDRISLSAGQHAVAGSPDKARSEATAEAIGWTSVALISFPLATIAVKMMSDATVVNRNFKAQEFQTKTLSPGQSAQGFVYFQLPQGVKLPDQGTIRLEALEAINKEVARFEFTFSSEGKTP